MYKLAVFDMDGTILNSKHEISKENKDAIKELENNGVKIVIATGRPGQFLKKFVNDLEIKEYVITCNGSVIGKPFTDDFLHINTINKETVIKIVDMCEENHYDYLLYTIDTVVTKMNDKLNLIRKAEELYEEKDKAHIIQTEDPNYIKNNFFPNKILITEKDPVKFKKLWDFMKGFRNIEYTQSWVGALDVSPLGDTKGNAVKILAKHYGIKKEEIVSFGDQLNDITMIKYAGLGIAMGNAEDEVKQIADYVTLTNDESGVAFAIKKIILKEL